MIAVHSSERGDPANWYVREAAVEKLTVQDLLAKIALKDEDDGVRHAAKDRLSPQTLEKISEWIKPDATRQVTDEAVLAKIALEARNWYVRGVAVKKLADQDVLGKVATDDEKASIRVLAVAELTGKDLLAKIATDDKDTDVRAVPLALHRRA